VATHLLLPLQRGELEGNSCRSHVATHLLLPLQRGELEGNSFERDGGCHGDRRMLKCQELTLVERHGNGKGKKSFIQRLRFLNSE
jgi:hypothetical protein